MGTAPHLSLRDLRVNEGAPRECFDRVVRVAGRVFRAPVVAVNLLDDDFLYTVATVGGEVGPIPRRESICADVVDTGEPLVIADAHEDPKFRDHPAVRRHPRLRFYAGAPLKAGRGDSIGALCIIDDRPRDPGDLDLTLLMDLAAWLERELRVERDLMQAAEVQRALLPARAPTVPGLEVAGRCVSAHEISGDSFDWQVIDGHLQLSLVDVMGKGISAALIAAQVRATMRGAWHLNGNLAEAVSGTATAVDEDLEDTERFATLFVARIDPRDGTVEYVDAGHGLAVIVSERRPPRRLTSINLPLGVRPNEGWELGTDRLADDEFLLAVSDGVVEVFPDSATALERARSLAAGQLGAGDLVDRVIGFAAEQDSTDDITAIVVRRDRMESA